MTLTFAIEIPKSECLVRVILVAWGFDRGAALHPQLLSQNLDMTRVGFPMDFSFFQEICHFSTFNDLTSLGPPPSISVFSANDFRSSWSMASKFSPVPSDRKSSPWTTVRMSHAS